MREITLKQAKENKLNLITKIVGTNLSHTILMMERLKENNRIKYYIMELAVVNEETHNGQILVSFWG